MSLENPPQIPFELVKELADLLRCALDEAGDEAGEFVPSWEAAAYLALDDYEMRVALNG